MGRALGAVLVIVIILGLVAVVSKNLNERFDEHMQPTGEEPTIPMWKNIVLVLGGIFIIGVIASIMTGGHKEENK